MNDRLAKDGFVRLSNDHSTKCANQETLDAIAASLLNRKRGPKGYDGRSLIQVASLTDQSAFMSKYVLTNEVKRMMDEYLGKNWYWRATQCIVVPPHSPVQTLHRDYSIGPQKALTIVVSLTERNLHTLVEPGSHLEEYRPIYKQSKVDEDRKRRLARTVDVDCPSFAYDPYIFHAGNKWDADFADASRLFITFYAGNLEREEVEELDYANSFRSNGKKDDAKAKTYSILVCLFYKINPF